VLEIYETMRQTCPDAMISVEQQVRFDEYVPGGFGMVWLGTWPKDNSPKSVARADKFLESTLDRMEATGWKGISQVQIHIRTDLSLPDPFCPSSDCIRRAIGRLHANGITVQAFTWTEGANKDALRRIWKLGFDNCHVLLLKEKDCLGQAVSILKKREDAPEFVPVTMSSIPLVRMSRRLCGRGTLREPFVRAEDSIGMTGDWTRRGPVYEIPFSCLVGDRVSNLIAAGRIISVSDEVWNVTRVIPPCAVTGQAAGAAAALFPSFRDADVGALQRVLREQGVKLHTDEVL